MSIIIPANSALGAGGFAVANGVRFNSASSESLSRDPSSSGSLIGTNTISFWVKRSTDNTEAFLVYAIYDANYRFKATFLANGKLQLNTIIGGSNNLVYETNRLFRDTSAWYHLVFAFDGRLAVSAGDRCRIYVNGVEETSFSTETNMGSDTSNFMSDKDADVYIGAQATGNFFDGYISEFVFIDEQQLTPTSFGEFNADSGVWQPLESVADLTFGTNGFYLDFQDSSALGNDVSGNNNDYTANNLAAIDQSTDTCTNNFATINPLVKAASAIPLSEGNTVATFPSGWIGLPATFGMQSGKWYWEQKVLATNGGNINMGIVNENLDWDASDTMVATTGAFYYFCSGRKIINNSATEGFFASYTTNDIISIALDLDASTPTIIFYKNGTATPNSTPLELPANLNSSLFTFPYFIGNSSSAAANWSANFGNPSFSISSGNTDGNGYGNFEYAVPSGYLALCTKNLSEVLS